MNDWISVKDHLPEDLPEYKGRKAINLLVSLKSRYPNGKPLVVKRQRKWDNWYKCWVWSKNEDDVTHWMPLPEPPEVRHA